MKSKYLWWIVIPLWGVASWFALSTEMPLTWRFTLVFGFLIICPGRVLIHFLPISDELTQWPLSIALSILLNAIVALLMIYTGFWEPHYGLLVILGMSILGIILQMILGTGKTLAS